MRIAEYKQIDERIEVIHHEATYDEDGSILAEAYDEDKHIPIMDMVYRDMTPEEIADLPQEEPTQEEPTQEEPTTEELAEDAYLKAEYNSILLEMIMEE